MSSWASPRDELPESVHALMSLWGGFAQPTRQSTDGALEKRLEVDLAAPLPLCAGSRAEAITVAELEGLMGPLGQYLVDYTLQEEEEIAAVTFTEALVVLTPRKLVVTAAPAVMLHQLLRPLLAFLSGKGTSVEWAAFFRKNICSPWAVDSASDEATSDVMAVEYAELKAAFPTGQSFLTGPVDGDHYFHFVYDNITRDPKAPVEEKDVQVNVFLYDCESTEDNDVASKDSQLLAPLPVVDGRRSEYEMLRTSSSHAHVSFETNAFAAMQSSTRVAELLERFAPSRFIIVALQDKDSAVDASVFASFDGYVRQHRSVNHFGEDYAFHQLVFTRAE